jgi:hypothetical protein
MVVNMMVMMVVVGVTSSDVGCSDGNYGYRLIVW